MYFLLSSTADGPVRRVKQEQESFNKVRAWDPCRVQPDFEEEEEEAWAWLGPVSEFQYPLHHRLFALFLPRLIGFQRGRDLPGSLPQSLSSSAAFGEHRILFLLYRCCVFLFCSCWFEWLAREYKTRSDSRKLLPFSWQARSFPHFSAVNWSGHESSSLLLHQKWEKVAFSASGISRIIRRMASGRQSIIMILATG